MNPIGNAGISAYRLSITPDGLQGRVSAASQFLAVSVMPLAPVLGGKPELRFEVRAAGETLNGRNARERDARQLAAEESFTSDPQVQQLIGQYGAQVVPDSAIPDDYQEVFQAAREEIEEEHIEEDLEAERHDQSRGVGRGRARSDDPIEGEPPDRCVEVSLESRDVVDAVQERVELREPRRPLGDVERPGMSREAGADECVVGRLEDAASLRDAFTGARTVFHIPPRMKPDEVDNAER